VERLAVHRESLLLGTLVARPEPIDDAAAVEVVCRQLDPDPVARVHANAKPPHLAGGVAESLVTVFGLDPEHAGPKRLDDLTGHLDLVFLLRNLRLLRGCIFRGARGTPENARSRSRSRPEGLSRPAGPRTPPSRLRRASGTPRPGSR